MRWRIREIFFINFLDSQNVRILATKLEKPVAVLFGLQFNQNQLTIAMAFPRPPAGPEKMIHRREDMELIKRGLFGLKYDSKTVFNHPDA